MVGTPYQSQDAEVAQNHYYDPHRSAGEEVSSTFEGRHVYIQEVVLIHEDISGDGLVQKGQPVAFYEGVGVVLRTAKATSDNIPIDTEGIWRLSVVSAIDKILIGQSLYITTGGIITDDPTEAQAVIGYALQTVTNGETAVIAVKVHWMGLPWILFWWFLWSQFK